MTPPAWYGTAIIAGLVVLAVVAIVLTILDRNDDWP